MYKNKRKKKSAGFTLVELMAVIIIVGLLFAVAAGNFMGKTDKARVTTTKMSLRVLSDAVLSFKMDTGVYPTEEDGLEALIIEPAGVTGWDNHGYLESTTVPLDAWGNEFIYQRNPDSGKAFVIISLGEDGEEEGEGYNADLYSTDAQ